MTDPDRDLEPPRDLDDIVLRNARQAIQTPSRLPLYKAPRWALPVALAATLLLCVSIVVNVSLNAHKGGSEGSASVAPKSPPKDEVILPEATVVPHGTRPPPRIEILPSPSRAKAPPADAAGAGADAARLASGPTPPAQRDPGVWLEHIASLRAAGKTDEAEAELRRFQAAFPNYPATPQGPPSSDPPK